MKPDQETTPTDIIDPSPVSGDVIGDTAYSERFVLKILLKFANLDTLKDEINEKSFEDDLCILWDMTAEKDVVTFLQKHDVLKLFHFALPVIESSRIIEITVGIIANMCCQKEVVSILMKMDSLLSILVEYLNTDDSLLIVQVMRMINSCMFLANEEEIKIWMSMFVNINYSSVLYFILKNSSHKVLLITALENINNICSYCNTERFRSQFFSHFVIPDALGSLIAALCEISINQKDFCINDELERVFVISLQTVLNLLEFDTSSEIYSNSSESAITMISLILNYYENKLVGNKEIDTDLIDVVDSSTTIANVLNLYTCEPSKYVLSTYNMWKTTNTMKKSDESRSFEEKNEEELKEFVKKVKPVLSTLICYYLSHCTNEDLLKVLDCVGNDCEDIISSVIDKELQNKVYNRTSSYRTRLKETNGS